MPLKVNEKDLQKEILDYLQKVLGIFCWRNNTGAFYKNNHFYRFGKPGASDIIGILPDGKFLAIEVKRPHGKLKPDQRMFLDEIGCNGGVAIVARSLDDVVSGLDNKSYQQVKSIN